MAPSPAKMMTGRSGWPNLAPMPYGTPGPMVARVPDSEPRTSPRNFSCRAYQFADEPESAATMALAGSRVDSSRNSSIGLTGSASTSASASMDRHQRSTLASMPSRQDRSSLPLQVRDQRPQGGGRVPDQVDLVRVAHPDELAVDVDLDPAGLVELRQELRVGEVRAHREQGVAVHHQLVARPGAEQADGPGHVRQLVGEHVLAEQRLGHPGAEQLGDLLAARAGRRGRPARPGWRPCSRR